MSTSEPPQSDLRCEPCRPGLWKGQVVIADDFDELPPDLLAAFEGEIG